MILHIVITCAFWNFFECPDFSAVVVQKNVVKDIFLLENMSSRNCSGRKAYNNNIITKDTCEILHMRLHNVHLDLSNPL